MTAIRTLIREYTVKTQMEYREWRHRDEVIAWVHERNPGKRISASIAVMTVNREYRSNRRAFSNTDVDLFVERKDGRDIYLRLYEGRDDDATYYPIKGQSAVRSGN